MISGDGHAVDRLVKTIFKACPDRRHASRDKPQQAKQMEDVLSTEKSGILMNKSASSTSKEHYQAGRDLALSLRNGREVILSSARGPEANYLLDAPDDVVRQNPDSFNTNNVATMFTKQWVGIRQACGAFSGHKIAIDGHHKFDAIEIGEIATTLRDLKIDHVIYHGMASSTSSLLRGLKILSPSTKFYGVWHGTMAGWSSDEELALFREFLALADDKVYDRLGFLRQGMQNIHPKAYGCILYNLPPSASIKRSYMPFAKRPIRCIFPSWNNAWKNMYTNLLAANISPIVGDIFVYYKPQLESLDKVRFVEFGGHDAHFQRVAKMDLCLNVSVNDCQPMAELEGLSVGTPSLRNDWNLDLETPSVYEKVFTVKSYLNVNAIAEKILEIADLDPNYIYEITKAHKEILISASRQRYTAFLGGA
ncbi:hypothetical protein [Methylorubrum thiocyanatum]|uniref:hypothetical protein n=1 Tax=Methylorubrum thiocyanatum TaxID=47958 RepID=UPI0036638280